MAENIQGRPTLFQTSMTLATGPYDSLLNLDLHGAEILLGLTQSQRLYAEF